MKNRYEIDARKSDAKIQKNERKWNPHGSQNPLKINKNEVDTSMRKMIGGVSAIICVALGFGRRVFSNVQ